MNKPIPRRRRESRHRALLRRGPLTACAVVAVLAVAAGAAVGQQREPPPAAAACDATADPTVPSARVAALARGFNLAGWLDGTETRRPAPGVLAELRRRGFTHIRLPVMAERLLEGFSTPDAVARDMAELDQALDSLAALGFAVSLDLHPGGRLGRLHVAEPERAFELIEALWRRLARRHAGRPPERLFFELLNEPGVDRRTWDAQGRRLVDAVRREAPNHTIVFGPANFQRIDALAELVPLDRPNIVYAVHFYDPMVFTHQGLDWSDDPLRHLHGVPFPARLSDPAVETLLLELRGKGEAAAGELLRRQLGQAWTATRVAAEIGNAAAWAKRHRRHVILNEFGVLAWKAAADDRIRWLRAVRVSAERYCLGWAHWDYADGFGFVRRIGGREIPDEAVVRALLDE